MKKFLMLLCAVSFVLGISGVASANLFLTEQFGEWLVNDSSVQYWEFDLNSTTPMDSNDVITHAYLNAHAWHASGDEALIEFDLGEPGTFKWEGILWGWLGYGVLVDVLAEVVDDHFLTVSMSAISGEKFKVDAVGVGGKFTAVPEPATFILLGLGLIGLSGIQRKKHFKK